MKKIYASLISFTLLFSSVLSSTFAMNVTTTADETAPTITYPSRLFIYKDMSTDEATTMLRQQVTAMDDVDGNITEKVQFSLPKNLNELVSTSITMQVKDTAGNRTVKYPSIYIVEINKSSKGLNPLHLEVGTEIDLLADVEATNLQGEKLKVEIDSIEKIESKRYPTVYMNELTLVNNSNSIYKVGENTTAGHGYKVTYRFSDTKGVVKTATRIINTETALQNSVVGSVDVSSPFVKPGEMVTIEASLIELENNIDYVYVSYYLDSNYSRLSAMLYYNSFTGKYTGNLKVPEGYENKIWKLDTISIKYLSGKSIYQHASIYQPSDELFVYSGIDLERPELTFDNPNKETALNVPIDLLSGVKAYDLIDGDLTNKIEVIHSIDYGKVGKNEVIYRVKDLAGNVAEEKAIVFVKENEKPILTIEKPTLNAFIQQGEDAIRKLIVENATAHDNYDGDITENIRYTINGSLTTPGYYTITYTISDQSENITTANVTLSLQNYDSRTSAYGDMSVIVAKGETVDLTKDFTVFDSVGEKLTPKITGEVNVNKVGTYDVRYDYTNRFGDINTYTRTFNVKEKTMPYFESLDPISTFVGKPVEYFSDVSAYDMFGKKLDMSGGGYVDFDVPGMYEYHFEATDRLGQTITGKRTIEVKVNDLFYDVPTEHPYFKEIYTLRNAKIINGYPGNLYDPKDAILRGQVAALITRSGIDLKPIRPAKQFKDVPTSHMFYNEIQTLYRAGIIDGTGEDFKPNDTLTCEQLAKILVLAFSLQDRGGYENFFGDINKSDWAYSYITNLASNGITIGANGNYMPKDKVTREQYAIFMYRALGY